MFPLPVRALATILVLLAACEEHPQPRPGPPMRLVSGASDTIVVNSHYPVTLSVRALDASGNVVTAAPVRFTWIGGDSVPVTTTGAVTCTRSGDLAVRAALGTLALRLIVQCRRVENVRLPGPLQFVLGDTALTRPIPLTFVAYDASAHPISPARATAGVGDSLVARLHGLLLSPQGRGITWAGVRVGESDGVTGVHVYQRVATLAALDTLLRVRDVQRLFAIPLRMARGDNRRQHLPPGDWMLVMLPETDTTMGRIHLRVEGARCQEHFLNAPRRWGCHVDSGATVVLYRPFRGSQPSTATGYLLVRWLFA